MTYPTIVHCWNVGHGEATLVEFPSVRKIHIVDFGSNCFRRPPSEHLSEVLYQALCIIRGYNENEIDIIITHLHYDHYSLIPYVISLKDKVNAVYLPVIPKEPTEVREKVCFLLVLQAELLRTLTIRFEKSEAILEDLTRKAKKVYLVGRGNIIRIDRSRKLYIRVLWPPYTLPPKLAEKALAKLGPLYEKARRLAEYMQVGDKVQRQAQKLSEYLERKVPSVKNNIESLESESEEPVEVEYQELISLPVLHPPYLAGLRIIEEFLEEFRDAVNDLSLVLEYYNNQKKFALIPGDNSKSVLDCLLELERFRLEQKPQLKHVVFLRGAHHGT